MNGSMQGWLVNGSIQGWLVHEQRAEALIALLRRLCAASNALRAPVSASLHAPLITAAITGTAVSHGDTDLDIEPDLSWLQLLARLEHAV